MTSRFLPATLQAIFLHGGGFARTKEIKAHKIHSYHLARLEKEGTIARVKRGLYKWVDFEFQGGEELAEVFRAVPKGVLCLLSALSFHELTDFEPCQYQLAIPRANHATLPSFPPIKIFYFPPRSYGAGIERVERDGQPVHVYNLEKTICDCAHYRRMVGQDLFLQGLRAYAQRPDKNIARLGQYAKLLRVDAVLRPYLEVLL